MTALHPDTDDMVQFVLDTLDEGARTGRDGDPATYLAVMLDTRGMWANTAEFDFPAEAHALWERVNVDDLTVYRFADADETVTSLVLITMERIRTEALLDLAYLVRRHLRQPPLPVSA